MDVTQLSRALLMAAASGFIILEVAALVVLARRGRSAAPGRMAVAVWTLVPAVLLAATLWLVITPVRG